MQALSKEMLSLVEKGVFSYVDFYFAKTFEKKAPFFLLAYLLAMARQGHLCVTVQEEEICPPPSLLTSDPEEISFIEKKVKEGFVSSPLFSKADPLIRCKDSIYLQKNWQLESQFLFHIQRLALATLQWTFSEKEIQINPVLNAEQKEAVLKAMRFPISFISGGPGTGKSFTAIEIIKTFLSTFPEEERKKVKIQLAAPTGKAAAHLQRNLVDQCPFSSQISSLTLHSLLEVRGYDRLEKQSPTIFADLLLVDEASMLDAELFVRLLSHLRAGGRLVLMGDKQQLPPVESGGFFADLIDLSDQLSIPSTTLQTCLRVEKKELKDLAEALHLQNREAIDSSPYVKTFASSQIKEIRDLIWIQAKPFFSPSLQMKDPKQAFFLMEEFRLLSCMRKGLLGVESINEMILTKCLEGLQEEEYLSVPILIRVNDRATNLVNGDTGLLVAKVSSLKQGVLTREDTAYFLSKEKEREFQSFVGCTLPSFDLGYCLSVHKSQGSEYARVLVLAPKGSEVFGREVVYTAITRAKKELLLLVEGTILKNLLERSSRKRSGLAFRLK